MALTNQDIDKLKSIFVTKQEFSEKIDSLQNEIVEKIDGKL